MVQKMIENLIWDIANFELIVLAAQKELRAQIWGADWPWVKFLKSDVDFEKSYVDLSYFGLNFKLIVLED